MTLDFLNFAHCFYTYRTRSCFFPQENLWNTHRSSWMQVKDLDFVEQKLIPKIEKYVSDMARFSSELVQNALENAAAEAAKEEAKAKGEAGLTKVAKRASTRPMSPKITQPRPPVLPEPEKISNEIKAKEVPGFLNNNTMETLYAKRREDQKVAKEQTVSKYNKNQEFQFHETKAGRPLEEVKKEIEEKRSKELAFDSSYYNPPPDFSRYHAKVNIKDNAATILKEDSLYRKQQQKDAQILRNYEEELRDPTEYYLWQKDMRERDEIEKLKHVALRREQAKQSAEEAKYASVKQKDDNAHVASLVRHQGEVIKRQKEIEKDIEILQKQEIVQSIIAVRETKPIEAAKKVIEERVEIGKKMREDLELLRIAKEEEEEEVELRKADRIRQLRALNTVHKAHIKVFDPTETAGMRLLDEMSYMEMKERQKIERSKQEEVIQFKNEEIKEQKTKKQADLERRSQSIIRARQLKAEANHEMREAERARRQKEKQDVEEARLAASRVWDEELEHRKAQKKAEQDALKAEEERIKRQQQYLGAAQGQVAIMRERQIQMARDRQQHKLQEEYEEYVKYDQETKVKEKTNKTVIKRAVRANHEKIEEERNEAFYFEKNSSIEKAKANVIYKKTMFSTGQVQHERTKTVLIETNPYGHRISEEVRTNAITRRSQMMNT